MSYMQRTKAFETGIDMVDGPHKRIAPYINELEYVSQTGDADNIGRAMARLLDYTTTHFLFDEELPARAGYPYLHTHKRVHNIFRNRLVAYAERAEKGENVPELLPMFRVWLSTQITSEDRDYVDMARNVTGNRNQEDAAWLAAALRRLFGAQESASAQFTPRRPQGLP